MIISMLSEIKHTAQSSYRHILSEHRSRAQAAYDRQNVGSYLNGSIRLSKDEKRQVQNKWGHIIKCISRGFDYYRGLKALDRFDADYLPSSYFFPYIEQILNPEQWKRQLSHKSLIELSYGTGVRHPHTFLRTYGGVLLDSEFKPLSRLQACALIKRSNAPLLYKPATDSEQGAGVRLIAPDEFDGLCNDIKTGNIFSPGSDFVLQEPVGQSSDTAIFNPTSLNCMRITTLNLNGIVSVGSRAIKCGPPDSVVDNIGSGKRGVIVGINHDGTLCDKGFYGNGESASEHNKVTFAGKKIEHFQSVVDAAIHLHEYTPLCKIIGWDIALDDTNTPVLIEGNTIYPGISFEQLCSGPIFGSRTDEVIDYLKVKMGGGKL